jgi:predicted anti-sigma-YlaC factor YlaD
MRCADLRARAREFFANRLAAEVRESCEAHLVDCAACAELFARGASLSEPDCERHFGAQWVSPDDATCAWILEFLASYVEGRAEASERAIFDAHLAVCPPCRVYLAQYAATMRLARDGAAPPQPMPPALIEAILAARRGAK